MLEAFGTKMPSQAAKNEYFFTCWMDWKNNELKTTSHTSPAIFKKIVKEACNQIGLKEFWDYQTRGYSIRFKEQDMLAFFKISIGDKWTT